MKNIVILIIAVSLSVIAKAQNQDPNIYPNAFLIDNHKEGSNILLDRQLTRIYGSLSMRVDNYFASLNYIETKFEIISGTSVLLSVDGPTLQKASDFYNNSYISNSKDFYFDISQTLSANLINGAYPNAKLVVKYRYRFLNSTSYLPATGYYTGTSQYSFKSIPLHSVISGPDQVCSSVTYTITNPGVISLENAVGIANLTNLGNNQWKVQRIGGASGKIRIVSTTSAGQTYKKDIVVGTSSPNFKYDYSPQLDYGQTYTFVVESDFTTDILEIEKLGNANIVFTRVDNNRFTIKTPPRPSNGTPVAPVYIFSVKARVLSTSCGNSAYITKNFQVGSLN